MSWHLSGLLLSLNEALTLWLVALVVLLMGLLVALVVLMLVALK